MTRGRNSRRGITNRQAKFLVQLQHRAGERYSGSGLSRKEASQEIHRLLRKLGRPASIPAPTKRATAGRAIALLAAPKAKARAAQRRERDREALRNMPRREYDDGPTRTQLHDLQVLATRAGEATPAVASAGDAARELARLRQVSSKPQT